MADSLQALALEPSSVKAQVFLGQSHLELDNLDEAFEHLQLGNCLTRFNRVACPLVQFWSISL